MATEKICSSSEEELLKDASMVIDDVENWIMDIETRFKDVDLTAEEQPWTNASIYKVPAFIKDLNPKAFTPELVSFGPYHHEAGELNLMEIHKEIALVQFTRRAGKSLNELVEAVEVVVYILQDSYYRLDEKWTRNKDGFLKLMILDGCFMFEVLRFATNSDSWYSSSDPFFSKHGIHHKMPYIRRDMLMIENQLPLLLLKTLFEFQNPQGPQDVDGYINSLVFKFVTGRTDNIGTLMSLRPHSLDLYRESLFNPPPIVTQKEQSGDSTSGITVVIRCAKELNEAGVRFRTSSTKSLRSICFNPKTGFLYLPVLVVDDATESTFLNILAYENLHVNVDHDVTSYVCLMDELIDSVEDVSLLRSKGIIMNNFGSDKAVASLFNRISKEVTVDPRSSFNEVRWEVYNYCQKKQHKWRATLVHTYFRNPWSALSLAGALLVIGLTISQTVFTILQYYQ